MSLDRIFKTSAMTGAMSIVTMVAALLRGKVMAMCLGPAGVGLSGILNQVVALESQVLALGLPTVVVKSVAGADVEARPQVESVIARLALALGVFGLVLGLVLSPLVAVATFQSFEHLPLVIAASLAVPAAILTSIWCAVIQGRGEVGFLARSQAAFAVVSALVAVPLIWYGGLAGLGVSVVLAALIPVAGLWSRRPRYPTAASDDKGIRDSLVRAGLSIIATIAIAQVAAYATRLVVVNQLGVFEAGLYQAALAVSGGLPGFVFSAMALDYYPRISAARDGEEIARATNMQVQASMVIATPLFVGMIVFGGPLLDFYYTEEFLGATELMAWMTASVAFRIISWPAGYWLVAKATPREYLLIEGPAALLAPLVTIALLPSAGLAGAGIAMVLSALVYALVIITFMRRRGGLGYTAATWWWAALGALQVALAFGVARNGVAPLTGGLCLAASVAVSLAAYPVIRHAKA
ncbi:lipid III flippase [Opitutia bacterium]|nr:lipid III flippase [Opitutae bacterium]